MNNLKRMVIHDQTPRTNLQRRCTLPVKRRSIVNVPNWNVRQSSLHESFFYLLRNRKTTLKPLVLFFNIKRTEKLTLKVLIHKYALFLDFTVHSIVSVTQILSLIEEKVFLKFF